MIAPGRMVVYGGEGDDEKGAPCTFGDLHVYDVGESVRVLMASLSLGPI